MTRITRFSDAFWGKDFCDTTGFETLIKRLQEGRQMCKEFDKFLKARAKLEEDYAKELQKMVRNAAPTAEIGTLKMAWEVLKLQADQAASEHLAASQAITQAAQRLEEMMESQKVQKKQEEDLMRKLIKKKLDCHKKTMEAKKNFHSKCKEKEDIDQNLNITKQTGMHNIPAKDIEKMYVKQTKVKQEVDKIDQQYRSYIDNLEQIRIQFEKETARTCDVFQQLEEERIGFIRNEMWVHTNILSQTCVDDDEHYEEARKSLELCDVEKDIIQFVNEKKTSMEKPSPVQYESYGSSAGAAHDSPRGTRNFSGTATLRSLPETAPRRRYQLGVADIYSEAPHNDI